MDIIVLDPLVASPLFLSSEPPPIHVVCQTQHLRHFLRGPLSSPFLQSVSPDLRSPQDMSISNPSAWVRNLIQSLLSIPAHPLQGAFGLVWYVDDSSLPPHNTIALSSSAKDQLTGASVAIKKIMKPFSTPVLSKRTYRELKLLKHIQHENVCLLCPRLPYFPPTNPPSHQIISLSDVFISPLEDMWVSHTLYIPLCPCPPLIAFFGQLFRD